MGFMVISYVTASIVTKMCHASFRDELEMNSMYEYSL